ncbi:MAG: DUF2155 domain-containing protein [Sphingomonadales bacterium]|jgi:hypothetical protein
MMLLLAGLAAAAMAPVTPPDAPTPLAERVAGIGVLNKRTGVVQRLALKPGQQVTAFGLTITLKSCETTPPWERPRLTGAFVQVDEQLRTRTGAAGPVTRIFSGWLFAESPSLNVVESPRYDVWVNSCTMRWPVRMPDAATSASNAPKSPDTASASRN